MEPNEDEDESGNPKQDEILDRLIKQHGDVVYYDQCPLIVFRRPTGPESQMFIQRQAEDEPSYPLMKRMILACCVYPNREEAKSILSDYGFLTINAFNELSSRAGMGFEAKAKKA